MPFNKVARKLIKAQGPRGVSLLQILDEVETYGSEPFGNSKLEALVEQCPRVAEYNVAIQPVLENYATDIVGGMVRCGVHNGLDVWRRLFHHYVPSAGDRQQILIQELYDLKPVNEPDVDILLNEIQRIPEWYVRAGSETIAENWFVAVVKRNLPTETSTDLSMELRKLNIADEIRNVVNVHRHDHRTGLPLGAFGAMLAMPGIHYTHLA